MNWLAWYPVVDNVTLPLSPLDALRKDRANPLDALWIDSVANETYAFLPSISVLNATLTYDAFFKVIFGKDSSAIEGR